MPTITLSRKYAFTLYSRLKAMPPKAYESTEEIQLVIEEVLPALKPNIPGYDKMSEGAKEVNKKWRRKELDDEARVEQIQKLQNDLEDYEEEHGDEPCKVEFSKKALETVSNMFEKHGKEWAGSIEDYAELNKQIS